MTTTPREAPVADWISIPDLYRDPFPAFERMRAEGGVHWVPAIGRYLITSYDAVHDTELDQTVFSADEQGSLMKRAMGHSMLRKDDPEHHIERRAWQPVLRPGVVKRTWLPKFEEAFERTFADFVAKGPGADLIWDFAAPYSAESLRLVLGIYNASATDMARWSQTLIDATGNYADDPEVWARGERSFTEVDAALDEMLSYFKTHEDDSMLSAFVHRAGGQVSLESIRANVKMTIGGGLNEPRDAIGVATWGLLTHPEERARVEADPRLWDSVFDEAIRWISPIGMYSRQTTRETVLQGVRLPKGAKLGVCLISANRDEGYWPSPEQFDITRVDQGAHLAFGKGVHVCLGAWVARAEVASVALPRLFSRLDQLSLDPEQPAEIGGWVFRGMTKLPLTWNEATTAVGVSTPPSVAVIGSGPSGCYVAQALRRSLPDAEIDVIDQLPVPYGLVRHGVAADHQGTKALAQQFARLFEHDGVRFVGDTTVGDDVSLDQLRHAYDAVVVATGLHRDVQLEIPGAQLPGVCGAGRVTRLLNAHPLERRPAASLGATSAIIGMGNVAMDLVRMLAKRAEAFAESDIDDAAHQELAGALTRLHVVGRSQPSDAKFDPVMVREIAELPGVDHIVHGNVEYGDDVRSSLIRDLAGRERTGAPGTIEWWFGAAPVEIEGAERVRGLTMIQGAKQTTIAVDSVVTAIGFAAAESQSLVAVDEASAATGRIEHGLYVAGWARRGPRGTIPTQRQDARELAETIVADVRTSSVKPGRAALTDAFAHASSYDGWLLIDAHEAEAAPVGRVRAKVTDVTELRRIASAAAGLDAGERITQKTASESRADLPPLTVMFATESGNAELVAEELAAHLEDRFAVQVLDLAEADVEDIPASGMAVVVSSTYGDGELPTGVRDLHARLTEASPDLSGLQFAMFGLGDHSYSKTYSRGSEVLDALLASLGATRVGEYGRHDAAGTELAPDVAREWCDATFATLAPLIGR